MIHLIRILWYSMILSRLYQKDDDDDDDDGVVREVMMGMVGPHGSIVGTPRSQ